MRCIAVVPSRSAFVYTNTNNTNTNLGARLCTDTSAKAAYIAKMGDIVRWVSPNNLYPSDKMRIVTLYYDANKNPLLATVIDGTVYFTMPVGELILWK